MSMMAGAIIGRATSLHNLFDMDFSVCPVIIIII